MPTARTGSCSALAVLKVKRTSALVPQLVPRFISLLSQIPLSLLLRMAEVVAPLDSLTASYDDQRNCGRGRADSTLVAPQEWTGQMVKVITRVLHCVPTVFNLMVQHLCIQATI